MKQGKHYTTVILWIFIAAIAAYFGYNVVSSLTEPLTTASVIEYEAGAGCYTTGFLVRDEEVLTSAYDITVITCAEGAHVSANEAVATGYLTDGAQQRQTRIQTLQEQLTQLQYAYSASSSLADQAALDALSAQFPRLAPRLEELAREENPQCRALGEDYPRLIQDVGSREALTRRFFLIFHISMFFIIKFDQCLRSQFSMPFCLQFFIIRKNHA